MKRRDSRDLVVRLPWGWRLRGCEPLPRVYRRGGRLPFNQPMRPS
jgi:hypothetical protein